MKHSAKVMAFVLAWVVTPAVMPQTSTHRQPANPAAPPATTQTQQQKSTQGTANRAKGAAAELQLEPLLRATLLLARSSELGIPVAKRGGPIGKASNTYRTCMR